MWSQICSLSVESPSSVIALQVFHRSTFGKKCLAKKEMEIVQLLETDEGQKDFSVVLNHVEKSARGTPEPTLVVRMTAIGHVQAAAVALANATQDIGILPNTSSAVGRVMNTEAGNNNDLLSNLGTVLSRLTIIGAELSKIHPYSNVAWKVLFSVYEAVQKQTETDADVCRLVQTMADVYAFVKDIESASEKITRFAKQSMR
ncbi:hypothetical protein BDP27DRAFT_433146 [Rhodocollybia butyracea]|uniref:Uncharacterized protein n=1 Tax=Rhodocollybia butyracea TaxID=206335 RepID=A0A9P5PAY4_9AGAR|nr:hypothetical protein BDP27DRAFT_433146 [Rhodocollybia butyracea]